MLCSATCIDNNALPVQVSRIPAPKLQLCPPRREAEASILLILHAGVSVGDRIPVSGASRQIVLLRPLKITELRGMRRAHINLARLCPPQDTSKKALIDGYIDYVNAQLKPDAKTKSKLGRRDFTSLR